MSVPHKDIFDMVKSNSKDFLPLNFKTSRVARLAFR